MHRRHLQKNESILNAPTSSAVITDPTGWPVILRTMMVMMMIMMMMMMMMMKMLIVNL